MKVITDYNRPYQITSLSEPLPFSHVWTFNASMSDFSLTQLTMIEGTYGPAIKILVQGVEVILPASWYIMAVDREVYTVDTIPLEQVAGQEFEAFVMSPTDCKLRSAKIAVLELIPDIELLHPILQRSQMLCCSLGDVREADGRTAHTGLLAGPYDLKRHIDGMTVGDLLG